MKRIQTSKKSKTFYILFCTFYLLLLSLSSGCGNKFFDPTQIGRFRPTPAVNVILDTLGVAEEEPPMWEGAEEPRPEDSLVSDYDYVFCPGDIVRVSIYELYQDGLSYINDYVVTETGKISIPDVGVVQAEGVTEIQLEEEIKQILSPSVLRDPSVVVTLLASEKRTFSILGDGISIPGRYVIPRYDFRLTEALATAGGHSQFNISYIYVCRHARDKDVMAEPMELEIIEPEMTEQGFIGPEMIQPEFFTEPGNLIEPEREFLEVITPLVQHQWPESKVVIASAELIEDREVTDIVWPGEVEPTRRGVRRSPIRSREQQWIEPQEMPEPTLGITDSERTDKPVSIQDILKTLSERARQERMDEQVDVDDTVDDMVDDTVDDMVDDTQEQELFSEPFAPETFGEPTEIEEALKSFGEPVAPEIPEIIEGPIDVMTGEVEPTFEPIVPEIIEEQIEKGEGGRIEWIFQAGKWVPVQVGPPAHPVRPELPGPAIEFEPRRAIEMPSRELVPPGFECVTRVIKIPTDKLRSCDPRYDVIIKSGDSIHIPVDVIGEFCIMGNTNYQGYINMTGRPLTLKMAIASAGGLDALAWPKRCEVVRRLDENKEEIVMVDLDKIASGEQPDFFIKPNDLINVGTHPTSIWRAVLRNAFRATYGFGFVYDRNFADRDFGNSPLPNWF